MSTLTTATSIESEYSARFAGSMTLWERARRLVPSGINHDVRRIVPFPLYMDHAQGCRKWDVDGNEFLDLCTGHGSLMLGHGHPAIVQAVQGKLSASVRIAARDGLPRVAEPTPVRLRNGGRRPVRAD